MYPKVNEIYTLDQICNVLELDDIPCLEFKFGRYGNVQMSHVTNEQILSIPLFSETKWKYIRTTFEWIPIFKYSEENKYPISRFLDLEINIDQPSTWWATPKGFPRKQYREDF
ncbi:MAG TPA: hypothetical protein PLS50_00290 [Candidatus Dojkabacteria bacterium]|nr:hypothetical protein [Candidatus Dojkabacteria bacterium]